MEVGHKLGCHQRADRSFFIGQYQFPVCARCTGVIIGQFLEILFIIIKQNITIYISFCFMLIMFLDWFLQYKKIKESNNIKRIITGILGGLGLTYLYYFVIIFIYNLIK